MKTYLSKFCTLVLLVFIISCQTKTLDYKALSYTELDARENEISLIREKLFDEPLKSLWRSVLLVQTACDFSDDHKSDCENLFQEASNLALDILEKNLENKNLIQAKLFYNSLENLRIAKVEDFKDAIMQLEKGFFESYVAFSQSEIAKNKESSQTESSQIKSIDAGPLNASKISQYLKGLVTVWVDRGVSVQRGLGLPDRIIGSGFFIDSQGHLITNYHVIQSEVDTSYKGYSRVYVKLYDDVETRYPARVIGYDKALDLALLKTESPVPYSFNLGSSESLEVGDRIFAMGSPLGLENTITSGIVSSKSRSLSTIASVMQIDAAVNPGNSGGPIIDGNGLVQAIVFAGVQEYEGLNFAIPVEQLQNNLIALFNGEVQHSYSGFYAKTKRDLSQQKDLGLEVHYLMQGSAAQKAGLEKSFLIQKLNDSPITNVDDFQNAMLSIPPGMIIRLSGLKEDGKTFEVFSFTEERPEMPLYEAYKREPIENFFLPIFGMQLKRTSVYNKNQFEITSIIKGSIADENSFSIQDPVEIKKIKILEKNSIFYAELFTRKRNKAYFEVNMALGASMDSPYFF